MASILFDPKSAESVNQQFRAKRFQHFISLYNQLNQDNTIRILDVGGTELYWERMNFVAERNVEITLVNLDKITTHHPKIRSVQGDACNLSCFSDKEFDIVFSNSVIEHLFTFENQQKMANEVMRIGKNYYVQTPNYYFPIEPHWMFPFFQFLPYSLKVKLTQNFNLGHYPKAEDIVVAKRRVDEVQLLSRKEMQLLFPNATVYKETLLGLVKSITVYHFVGS